MCGLKFFSFQCRPLSCVGYFNLFAPYFPFSESTELKEASGRSVGQTVMNSLTASPHAQVSIFLVALLFFLFKNL